jgi:hypothetical protein
MFAFGTWEIVLLGILIGVPALAGIAVLVVSLVNKGRSPPAETTSAPAKHIRCPYCEHKLPAHFKVCTACGKPTH